MDQAFHVESDRTPADLPDDGQLRRRLDRLFPGGRLDRVLLVNPPDVDARMFRADVARRGICPNFPPYGLMLLAQRLRAIAVEPRILNLNHEVLRACREMAPEASFDFDATWQRLLDAAIAEFAPQLVGVSCMFTMTHESLRAVCARAAGTGIPVAVGGVHVTNDVERVLDAIPQASVAFLREGDDALPRFVEVVRGDRNPGTLAQVIVVDGAERHRRLSEALPEPATTDVIPAYELTEMRTLADHGIVGSFHFFKARGTRFATALTSRGCRARCTFCSVRTFNGPGVRQRSVDSVLDELERLEQEFDVGHVMWLDDDLLKDHRRALALFEGMVRRGLRLTWDASNGVIAASCTEEIIAAAAASGCIGLIIGMESGNPAILRRILKPGTVDTFLRAAEVLRRHERIYANAYLIIGFPGETMGMIRDTIDVSRRMGLDWYRIKPLQPLPSTPIFDTMAADGLLGDFELTGVRYMTGAYGRHWERDPAAATDPRRRIEDLPDDVVPSPETIDDVWFYMNYALNYARVLDEQRPAKLAQHRRFLGSICEQIAPDNAFALYCLADLEHRTDGAPAIPARERLERRVRDSPLWAARLRAFGLDPSRLGPAS